MVMVRQMLRSSVVLVSALMSQGDPTSDDMHAPFPTESHICNGKEVVRESCTMMPCDNCIPQNCMFSAWTQWSTTVGCNGLAMRKRQIIQENNRCGSPCDGNSVESKRVPQSPECSGTNPVDCMLTPWTEWSYCKHAVSQSVRTRRIRVPAYNGGSACSGDLNETKPCGNPVSGLRDCEFSDWHEWTMCSQTCGGGWKTRYRRIAQKSGFQGAPCAGNMSQIAICSSEICPSNQDCLLDTWSNWFGCDDMSPHQKVRTRRIAQYASGSGEACSGSTRDVAGCIKENVTDAPCILDQWSEWGACTATCEGGQKTRYRRLARPAVGLGTCQAEPLQETIGCGRGGCNPTEGCKFTQWEQWSACLPECGKGIKYRSRTAESPPVFVSGCDGVLKEVSACENVPCTIIDCVWNNWDLWTACTSSCGGGTKRRTRSIQKSPRHGGRLCTAQPKEQLEACNTESCDGGCRNATWGLWSAWSTCSVSCGHGYEMRERSVDVEASMSCGTPVSGPMEEFRACNAASCTTPIDCKLSTWSSWSACTSSCFGIRHRTRVIEAFPSEGGVQCDATQLKVIEACNPGPGSPPSHECDATPARDCIIEDWGAWSHCPVTCGGGQQIRNRQVLAPPSHNGKPCYQDLAQTRPCSPVPCARRCIDCHWGMWSQWGACTKCDGQRWRSRTILQHPNHCGARCEPRSAKEVSNCTGDCSGQVYCTWTQWTGWEACDAECGPAVKKRQRSLGLQVAPPSSYLFKGNAPLVCTGTIFDTEACPTKPCEGECVPQPCVFNSWSEWSDSGCTGLCQRSRTVRTLNNRCGTPCSGPTIESKRCPTHCNKPMDCEFHDWGAWTRCRNINGQQRRSRGIKQMPQAGGLSCNGTLMESRPCKGTEMPVDCTYSPWSVWSRCSVSCGSGWQMRNRHYNPGKNGGLACSGSLKELQPCSVVSCGAPTDCLIEDWSAWSPCYANGQKVRERKIAAHAIPPGKACEGALKEVLPCGPGADDCKVSQWTAWDECDKRCDGGQSQRHRQIDVYPRNGGAACPQSLIQTRGCNTEPCGSGNCEAYEWTSWTACDTDCGPGQQLRTRTVKQLRSPKGEGCDFSLNETKPCHGRFGCGIQDCEWDDWQEWGACTCTCGGGQKRRNRHIAKSAMAGGLPCQPKSRQEIVPCNTQTCCNHPTAIDGTWANWEEWSPCSSSCGIGIHFRSRNFATPSNEWGHEPAGPSQEVKECQGTHVDCVNADCLFGQWSSWSACSPTCYGKKLRSRVITQQGRGNGKSCIGPLQETWPCNPETRVPGDASQGYEDPPRFCPKVGESRDCRYSFWSNWGMCSATCGGGQQSRARVITTPASQGGAPCNASLEETRGCSEMICEGSDHPVFCQWAAWSSWGACDRCGGQRIRSRQIAKHPSNGGLACAPSDGQETEKCRRHCHDASFCVWGDWGPYSECSVTCGSGMRSRERSLVALTFEQLQTHQMTGLSGADLERLNFEMPTQAKRKQALAMAFLAGAGSLIVVFSASRFVWRRRHSSSLEEGYVQTSSAADDSTLTSLD